VAALMVLIGVVGLQAGHARRRIETTGVFYEAGSEGPIATPAFFRGLRAGATFRRLVAEIDQLLRVLDVKRPTRVFFGPHLEFAYAAFGFSSPRLLPVWWHAGTSYDPAAGHLFAQVFRDTPFDLCVFRRDDFYQLPVPVLAVLRTRYLKADRGMLTVFVHRDAVTRYRR
jgi:hypothetical protein